MTMTDGTETVQEPAKANRQVHQVRYSKETFLELLRANARDYLAAEGIDVSLIDTLTTDDMGWVIIGGTMFVTFNEPWPDGLSQTETAERVQAESGTTDPTA